VHPAEIAFRLMPVEDRDRYRSEKPRRGRRSVFLAFLIVAGFLASLATIGVVVQHLRGPEATYGGKQESVSGRTHISLLPGLPSFSIGGDSPYAKDDPWKAYLADERACPGGERSDAPLGEQANTMACLVNFARQRIGLPSLVTVTTLNEASLRKLERIVRCRDFNHDACGTDSAADIRALGYRAAWGENLYIAGGPLGAPRVALDQWLNSDSHRENLFRPGWRTEGIAVQRLARFGRDKNMTLWVNQFGES
jgi:uncharacterized protein YkwD